MYSDVPVPETEYGVDELLLTVSMRCGATLAMGKIDGIVVEVDRLGLGPLVVVRTIPVMVLPPPETMLIEF